MIEFNELVKAIAETGFDTRKLYHITLGKLIEILKNYPEKNVIFDNMKYPSKPHSYRGYYSDLAFEESNRIISSKEFIEVLEECIDKNFEGYKGSDFKMNKDTPLWKAEYGDFGESIIDFYIENLNVVLKTKLLDI